jgi:hypothetical protein
VKRDFNAALRRSAAVRGRRGGDVISRCTVSEPSRSVNRSSWAPRYFMWVVRSLGFRQHTYAFTSGAIACDLIFDEEESHGTHGQEPG